MEMQFNQTVYDCLQCTAREYQTQEQTQEVRLPEGMPDIGTVLACWGQIILRGKEWRSDNVGISGGVMARVLYLPEDGSEAQCVEVWLPFQMKWPIPTSRQDGTMIVTPGLRSADARTLSARKLMVRTNIGVLMQALSPAEFSMFSPETVPEDVQLLKQTYRLCVPKEAGEKAFVLDEEMEMSSSEPKPARIIRSSLSPQVLEQKVMADKVIFRGLCIAHILYRAQDGQLYSRDFDIPFSQYAELTGEYDADAEVRMEPVITNLELEQTPEDKLHLKAGLSGQYVIYDHPQMEVVEDAYSPLRSVELVQTPMMIPSVLDMQTQSVTAQADLQTDVMRCVDVAFWPEQPYVGREGMMVEADLSGVFQMLYYDPEGQLQSLQTGWDDTVQMNAGENSRVSASVRGSGKPQLNMAGGGGTLQADLLLDTQTTMTEGMGAVTALEVGEPVEPDPQRPSLILRRVGTDTLWELAKDTGSTVEKIRTANDLQGEPAPERVLLIPLS